MDRCKKDVQSGFSWMDHLQQCDKEEELGCVLCGKPWQLVGALGREGHEMWRRRVVHPWEGSAGGLLVRTTIHVRGQGHLARARDADGQLHTHHPPCPMMWILLHYIQKQCFRMREGLVLSVKI